MTKPSLLLDTIPLYRFLEGDEFTSWLLNMLRSCGYTVASTEAVLVETMYFVKREARLKPVEAAEKILDLLDAIKALRDKPLRSPHLAQLGYTDTELLLATLERRAMLLTGDEKLALKARSNGVNSYVVGF